MTVNEVYLLMQYIVNKNQSGYLSPSQFNLVINQGQRSYEEFLLGQFQGYAPGRPIPRVQYGNNETTRQRLTPLIYGYRLAIDSQGKSPYPGDYIATDAMTSIYNFQRVRFVQQDALYSFYNSKIDPIATNPIFLIKDTGFQFYPTTLGQADLSYVRKAPNMVWGYTTDVNSRPVYSAAHSTQPVWNDDAMFEIIVRALALVGVNLQLGVVIQFAQQIKQGGQ